MRLLREMWEGLCGGLMGSALGNNTHENGGDRAGQREGSHCGEVARAASANPAGSSGTGMFFQSHPRRRGRGQSFVLLRRPVTLWTASRERA